MTTDTITDLDLTDVPAEAGAPSHARQENTGARRPRRTLGRRLLGRSIQPVTERLAQLKRACSLVRTSVDPGWVAMALVVAVMLGGFTWQSIELHRIEAKVDAASKGAEMPGALHDELRAQTERLTALISAQRQGGSAPPDSVVALTQGAPPAPSHTLATDGSHAARNVPRSAAAASSRSSMHSGAVSNANTTKVANGTVHNDTSRRP